MIPKTKPQQRSLFRSSNEDRKKRDEATLRQMADVTSQYLTKMEENSHFFFGDGRKVGEGKSMSGIVVPRFEPNEIVLETTIGMGEFGVVLKVGRIVLGNTPKHDKAFQDTDPISSDTPLLWLSSKQNNIDNIETDQSLREQLAKTCRRSDSNESMATTTTASSSVNDYCHPLTVSQRSASIELAPVSSTDAPDNLLLVIKQIRKDLYPKKRIEAAKDLAREAKLLARLQQLYFFEGQYSTEHPYHHQNNKAHRNNHPNIISLRGIVSDPGTPEFGILLDRLHLTLTELSTSWKKRKELILETLATASLRKQKGASSFLSIAAALPEQVIGTVFGVTQKVGAYLTGGNLDRSSMVSSTSFGLGREASAESLNAEVAETATRASPEALLLLGERILALWDVSEGMAHLHSHKILYRDLKTENVARTVRSTEDEENDQSFVFQNFDYRDQQRMQIFDFGLAKECKPLDRIEDDHSHADSNDTESFHDNYKMTGMTGTMRIMAPEVIKCLPYGLSVDVYSFGICMWEVFTGKKCNFLSAAEICDTKNTVRPRLPVVFDTTTERGSVGMPKKLQRLMQRCWHEDPRKRPSFYEISKSLRSSLAELHRISLNPQDLRERQPPSQEQETPQRNLESEFSSQRILDGGIHPMTSSLRACVNENRAPGGFWSKIQKPQNPKQYQHASTGGGSVDATNSIDLLSDEAGFWSRLEAIRASGLLDD